MILFQIFVEFETTEGSQAAQKALSGRSFAARVVVTSYLEEQKYYNADFS